MMKNGTDLPKDSPKAFDMVRKRMPKGNPAIGLLKEHVIIGFFEAAFGQARIDVPEDGTKRGYDVLLCGEKLSIKTRTNVGGFKVLWTVDNEYVRKEIKEGYFPESDILLVNIHWNTKRDCAFFIPVDVQEKVLEYYGRKNYLSSSTGSNNRGIGIQGSAVALLRNHKDTLSIPIDWCLDETNYPTPWDEWTNYWGLN